MAKRKVVVEGFLLSIYSPTEDRLSVQLDATHLSWTKYRNLIERLQDQFAEIDDAYKERETRGRGLRARHRRIAYGKQISRSKLLKFLPYPSRFANIIRKMRADLYYFINRQCLVLQIMEFGAYRRNIYLLPYPRAPSFMAYIEEMNKTIEELNQKIKAYRETAYFDDIRRTLKRTDISPSILNGEAYLPKISVDLTPLRLDPTIIEEIVETKYKETFERISEEEKRGLAALKRELENKRQELVIKAVETLRNQINEIVKRILAKEKLKGVKKELEQLRALATDVGLEAIATSVITPLMDVVEDPVKAEAVFGTPDLSEGINGRIAGLIETL